MPDYAPWPSGRKRFPDDSATRPGPGSYLNRRPRCPGTPWAGGRGLLPVTEGKRTASQVIPQIVSDNGNTVALVISSESSRPRLRTYDLSETIGLDQP